MNACFKIFPNTSWNLISKIKSAYEDGIKAERAHLGQVETVLTGGPAVLVKDAHQPLEVLDGDVLLNVRHRDTKPFYIRAKTELLILD